MFFIPKSMFLTTLHRTEWIRPTLQVPTHWLMMNVATHARTHRRTAPEHNALAQPRGGGAPPKLGSQENSWLRRWSKYTKLCMVWQPNILSNCYELCPPPYHPPGTSVPQTPCAPPPPPNPGYATDNACDAVYRTETLQLLWATLGQTAVGQTDRQRTVT